MVYAPTGESTEEELEKIYECLENAKAQCKAQELLIIMGDLNAKVGKEKEGQGYNVIGKHGLGKGNERGERFIQWCEDNNQIITNTWYEQHPQETVDMDKLRCKSENPDRIYNNQPMISKCYPIFKGVSQCRLW